MGREALLDAAGTIGVIMVAVVILAAGLCIFANEYFKRYGLPDDEGDGL